MTLSWEIRTTAFIEDDARSVVTLIDASNTATIFFSMLGDLTAMPTSPGFLSNLSYPGDLGPAPAPLPAFGLLLVVGAGAAAARASRPKTRRIL